MLKEIPKKGDKLQDRLTKEKVIVFSIIRKDGNSDLTIGENGIIKNKETTIENILIECTNGKKYEYFELEEIPEDWVIL